MGARLMDRFTVEDLSQAVGVSPRQLQDSFGQESGRSPRAEAKSLRLQRLRVLLLDPSQDQRRVTGLMAAAGLIVSGGSSANTANGGVKARVLRGCVARNATGNPHEN